MGGGKGGGSVLEQVEIYFRDGHETEIKQASDKCEMKQSWQARESGENGKVQSVVRRQLLTTSVADHRIISAALNSSNFDVGFKT